jgi:hypothetical protein
MDLFTGQTPGSNRYRPTGVIISLSKELPPTQLFNCFNTFIQQQLSTD